jgi:hypothetical protein
VNVHEHGRTLPLVAVGDNRIGKVSSMDEAMLALPEVIALDRRTVRRRFEERFSATRMARDYVNVYRKLLKPSKLVEPDSLAPSMSRALLPFRP